MASTRKSSKKASKAATSSKTAKSSKTARSSKATAAPVRSAASVRARSDVNHPPVIITDGSATIALNETAYRRVSSTNRHVSTNLRLLSVGANRLHDEDPETGIRTPVCYELDEDEMVEIRVTCRVGNGGPERSFIIRGGNLDDGSGSPVIEFDHRRDFFPPGAVVAGRRRFRSINRQIISLEIFSPPGSARPVHTCSVVENQTQYEISIFDDHL